MKVALDTNRYVDLCRGEGTVAAVVESADVVLLPFVVLAELRAGFSLGAHGRANERALRRFLMQPGVDVIYPDDATTYQYAGVYRQLRRQGTPIPTSDMWIAALALQHQLALASRDEHFDHLPQLVRV